MSRSLSLFHPAVAAWFRDVLGEPTTSQADGWPAIRAGRHTLISAPTGSGKTLAAFLCAIDDLVRRGLEADLEDRVHTVYVSPLRALSHDIRRNLQEPLEGIGRILEAGGTEIVPIRVEVRTGDTPSSERTRMTRTPPHLFVTTPESLYILLTSESGRRMLRTAENVIVDEIHAVVQDKRGSHLALSLERLDDLAGRRLTRVGLSATQRPIENVARYLVGTDAVSDDGRPDCVIVDSGHARDLDLAVEIPGSPLETVMSGEVWSEVHDRLAELIRQHRTTLVFVNTRRLAERVSRHLGERLGPDRIASHHGSLSRAHRLDAETRLKNGDLDALVATASLELGIDIGEIDLVCQLGSTRTIATLLQRVGRSGHTLRGTPRGRLFPLSRDELIECAALVTAVREGELDRLVIPESPLDILAQQIVATVAAEDSSEDALYELVRRAWPYRALPREDFDAVVRMLGDGFATARGRRGALLHRDRVNRRARGRRGARLTALTSGGAIPDNANYDVLLEPQEIKVGTVEEDFALENLPGHVFQLGNTSYRVRKIEPGRLRVEAAHGVPPSIPFWFGEAPARSAELSRAVSGLRERVVRWLDGAEGRDGAVGHLIGTVGLSRAAAVQTVDYLEAAHGALGTLPTLDTVVLERFFDEAGGMHVVLHTPYGSRINRAWGLALRKRFCRKFNFELQAAATEDAIVLSLGPTHSFPLDEVFDYLKAASVRRVLVQAVLDAPLFGTRWRWNATRSLAVPRFRGGRRRPPQFQRMDAEDLLAVVFPDQAACLENIAGDREVPDHPLVAQTLDDCLHEAMDVDGLERVLRGLEDGTIRRVARDLPEPSPLAAAVLNARPYAFLDDAPLEERRTRAVMSRRWLDPETAADLGALDPAAIEKVRHEAWPDPRDPDELHDALVVHGCLTAGEGRSAGWVEAFDRLCEHRRATVLEPGDRAPALWVAAERLEQVFAVHPDAVMRPDIEPPARTRKTEWIRDTALVDLVRGRLEAVGPATEDEIAAVLGIASPEVSRAMAALEAEGFALRGRYRPGAETDEWCDRRLLARIHRYTLHRLRREIEPVSAAAFVRFLTAWQYVEPGSRMQGQQALSSVIDQLDGFESPAAAWEADLLPARLERYDPAWLDALCLSGRVVWARRIPVGDRAGRPAGPIRSTPIAVLRRDGMSVWLASGQDRSGGDVSPSSAARAVFDHLGRRGASFFHDIVQATSLLRTQVEEALGELVSRGLVTSDGFSGLRALIAPAGGRRIQRVGRRRGSSPVSGMDGAGRWSLLRRPDAGEPTTESLESVGRALLRRWGVVFRRLLDRENHLPPWFDLLRFYRRLEARGEVRGGRFVGGFSGEQFALPEAVGMLRDRRVPSGNADPLSISAADPLNLAGIVAPGRRVPAIATNRILLLEGEAVAIREGGEVRILREADPATRWAWETALIRRGAARSPQDHVAGQG